LSRDNLSYSAVTERHVIDPLPKIPHTLGGVVMKVSTLTKLGLLAKTKNQKANILGNNLTFVLKLLVLGAATSLSILPPQLSYAQEPRLQSFRSVNFPDR